MFCTQLKENDCHGLLDPISLWFLGNTKAKMCAKDGAGNLNNSILYRTSYWLLWGGGLCVLWDWEIKETWLEKCSRNALTL